MKKSNLSEIDLITRKVSVLLNIPEDIIEKVMSFEKKSVREATYKHKVIEISNFATLSLRPRKIDSEIRLRENIIHSLTRRLEKAIEQREIENLNKRIEAASTEIEYLKTKL